MRGWRSARGFTLVELAMALFVIALLMGTVMYTLSAQNDQRMRTDTCVAWTTQRSFSSPSRS